RVEIYIKRDDLLRPLFGNKLRYLEYVLGAYDATGSDCLIHCGGKSSNYLAQLAMVGAQEGIPIHLVIQGGRDDMPQGNPLLEELFGAQVRYHSEEPKRSCSDHKQQLADMLRIAGNRPYVIDFPFSNYSAILGYMRAYDELRQQEAEGVIPYVDNLFLCSAGNSYLGLRLAADLNGDQRNITAISPIRFRDTGLEAVVADREKFLLKKISEFSHFSEVELPTQRVDFDETWVGDGYAIPSEESVEAVRLLASLEGILLDPVYTGKAMAGLIHRVRSGQFTSGSRVLFIHTGGWVNVFAFHQVFSGQH
ncbi:MAG: pyridoxal-phosphate dependent enzyme, partial [Gammaproteobacteria bacterium]|nr:pyridoxal-phosphate dependent enzyme [Gammaproteobacteria bacterium]